VNWTTEQELIETEIFFEFVVNYFFVNYSYFKQDKHRKTPAEATEIHMTHYYKDGVY